MSARAASSASALALALACVFMLAHAAAAHAEDRPGDPLAYDLRIGLYPVAFQAGASQSYFGSAMRAEYRIVRRLDAGAFLRVPLWNVTGEGAHHGYALGFNLAIHFSESLDEEALLGTVYPADPPAISGPGSRGADTDLDTPLSTRLGGPPMGGGDHADDGVALMYSVHSLRVGFSYVRTIEPARDADPTAIYLDSSLPLAHLGYGWGTHWNLPASVTGKRELGYRRFYLDALATLPSLVKERPLFSVPDTGHPGIFPLGARVGMEGSIDALLQKAPGVGFAYSIELGALPARNTVEGYLFVGLGIALDFATR